MADDQRPIVQPITLDVRISDEAKERIREELTELLSEVVADTMGSAGTRDPEFVTLTADDGRDLGPFEIVRDEQDDTMRTIVDLLEDLKDDVSSLIDLLASGGANGGT